jgi:sensor domain CHASE-containing protein
MKKKQLRTALIAVALLLIWWQASLWYQAQLMTDERTRIAGQFDSQGNSLAMAISERLELLEGLDAFVQAEIRSPKSALDDEFIIYAAQIYSDTKGIRNLAIAPNGVFRYVYPARDYDAMIGRSLFQDLSPAFREDMQKAIDTHRQVITNPHEMKRGGLGMVARKAVYLNETFWGIISITIDIPPMLQAAGLDNTSHGLDMALRDSNGQVFFGDSSVFEALPVIHKIELPSGYWELAGVPVGGWSDAVLVPLRIAQMAGLIILGLLVGLFYLVASRGTF